MHTLSGQRTLPCLLGSAAAAGDRASRDLPLQVGIHHSSYDSSWTVGYQDRVISQMIANYNGRLNGIAVSQHRFEQSFPKRGNKGNVSCDEVRGSGNHCPAAGWKECCFGGPGRAWRQCFVGMTAVLLRLQYCRAPIKQRFSGCARAFDTATRQSLGCDAVRGFGPKDVVCHCISPREWPPGRLVESCASHQRAVLAGALQRKPRQNRMCLHLLWRNPPRN
jgi:hypothetical protein